jgi:archaellum component FlaC
MSSIWQDVQTLKMAVRQLQEDLDGVRQAVLHQQQQRYLDGVMVEQVRVQVQRLEVELAGVKEAIKELLEDGEEWA